MATWSGASILPVTSPVLRRGSTRIASSSKQVEQGYGLVGLAQPRGGQLRSGGSGVGSLPMYLMMRRDMTSWNCH